MNCPHQPAHCRCPEHHLGLAAFAPDIAAYLKALQQAATNSPRRLAVVPVPETQNTYRGDQPQPWQPRPPRHLRAA